MWQENVLKCLWIWSDIDSVVISFPQRLHLAISFSSPPISRPFLLCMICHMLWDGIVALKRVLFLHIGHFLSLSTSFCAFSNVNSYHSQFCRTLHKPSVKTFLGICCTEMVFHHSGQLQNAFLVFSLIWLFVYKFCMKILKPFRFRMPYLSDATSPW